MSRYCFLCRFFHFLLSCDIREKGAEQLRGILDALRNSPFMENQVQRRTSSKLSRTDRHRHAAAQDTYCSECTTCKIFQGKAAATRRRVRPRVCRHRSHEMFQFDPRFSAQIRENTICPMRRHFFFFSTLCNNNNN